MGCTTPPAQQARQARVSAAVGDDAEDCHTDVIARKPSQPRSLAPVEEYGPPLRVAASEPGCCECRRASSPAAPERWLGDKLWYGDHDAVASRAYLSFAIDCATPAEGAVVRVVGSLPELGEWDGRRGVELLPCLDNGLPTGRWESLCIPLLQEPGEELEVSYQFALTSPDGEDRSPALWESSSVSARWVVCRPQAGEVVQVRDRIFGAVHEAASLSVTPLNEAIAAQQRTRPPTPGREDAYQFATSDVLLTFLLSVPESAGSAKGPWPVLLYLHGWFNRDTDSSAMPGLCADGWCQSPHWSASPLPREDCLVLAPQSPPAYYWLRREVWAVEDSKHFACEEYCPSMATALSELLDQTLRLHFGDPRRVYFTGVSMGGYGCLELARVLPGRAAAMALGAPHYSWNAADHRLPALVQELRGTAVWLVHGQDDVLCNYKDSELLVQLLRDVGGEAHLTSEGVEGHATRHVLFGEGSPVLDWLLSHQIAPPSPVFGLAGSPVL